MGSLIGEMVDYSAAVAGRIEGVVSIYGAGLGAIGDPLRPGQNVQAAPNAPNAPLSHWSDLPDAPTIAWATQNLLANYVWDLPMRLWLARGDLAEMRRTALPFYDRYLHAFMDDRSLGGRCQTAILDRFTLGSDDKWAWLDMNLQINELVPY